MSPTDPDTHWAGFDLGGTKMLAVAFDGEFRPKGRKRKRTKGYEGFEAGWRRMVDTLDQALREAKVDRRSLSGIGVGCPGPVDLEDGVIIDAVNLGWKEVPLRRLLEEEFRCPAVIVNDVDAGVYGEFRFGAAKDSRTVLGVFPGTGIGGGCVYDGQIIRGQRLSCMEFGHLRVMPNGRLCGCGQHGCLETEASRLAIAAEIAKAAYRGQAPYVMQHVGTNLTDIRSGAIADAIREGDQAVETIVRRAARLIGVAVADFIHLLSPDTIVLGGGLAEALPKLLVEEVERGAKENVMPGFESTFRVTAAALGDDACVRGAAAWTAQLSTADNKSV